MKCCFVIFFTLLFVCCKPYVPEIIYVKDPFLQPENSYSNTDFSEDFFKKLHFSYKEGVHLDSTGKFSYVLRDGTTDNTSLDTTRHYYTSETFVLSKKERKFLRIAKATLIKDTLSINLADRPFSYNWYECSIIRTSKQLSFSYYQTTFILDSSYRPPEFSTIEQHLLFDKETYQKGDTVKAKIIAKVAVLHSQDSIYRDTLSIYGLIKTLVE